MTSSAAEMPVTASAQTLEAVDTAPDDELVRSSREEVSRAAMWARSATAEGEKRKPRVLLARRGRAWEADQVAAHLMSCRGQMLTGLRRKTPWAGLDAETLESCFGHGAAVIARVAASGQRPEWRSAKDLEKAQIAAFRHQALDHWKRVNAQSRQGDRLAVAFDPDRHGAQDAPMDKLFEQPDLHAIQRDLLAELDAPDLVAFWSVVLTESVSFKTAGDRLGLSKPEVMSRTRAGRSVFAGYLDRRETGELCRQRGQDILALRAGTADERRTARANAHLEACYACSLVHSPSNGAIERGILGTAPMGILVRLATRAGDVASVPATRWTEAGGGGRLVAGGLAALTVAGTGVGIDAVTKHASSPPAAAVTSSPQRVPKAARESFETPALVIRRSSLSPAALPSARLRPAPPTRAERRAAKPPARRRPADATSPSSPTTATPTTSGPAASEFSFERGGAAVPTIPPLAPRPSPPPATEFAGP